MGKNRKQEMEDWRTNRLSEKDRLKYEIAQEIGLLDQVLEQGWKSLTAKETGRIGGLMTRRKKKGQTSCKPENPNV